MITRLEATRYRCFERLGIDVGDFRVLVGANGSGKTTLLDLPVLLGELLRTNNVAIPFLERRADLAPRAGSLSELVFAGRGNDFSLAVEARLPDDVQSKVLGGMFERRNERARQALQNDSTRWPTHIRYELGLRIGEDRNLQVVAEYLFLFPEAHQPDRRLAGLHGVAAEDQKNWHLILKREFGYQAEFNPETPQAKNAQVGLPDTLLGTTGKVDSLRGRVSERENNALSVRMELQADCFAGIWANKSQQAKNWLEQGDLESAMNAAARIGDDHLQRQQTGMVRPDTFTHGSSAQRQRWFAQGFKTGSVQACDTFNAQSL